MIRLVLIGYALIVYPMLSMVSGDNTGFQGATAVGGVAHVRRQR
jgi:hypothetical protein